MSTNYTQIGYVRQSDRRMVNLGRITGELENWDGSSGFTSYGQLTIEQAVWYKNQSRSDYRAFYPGPPSNPADQYGRYNGSIVNTTKPSLLLREKIQTLQNLLILMIILQHKLQGEKWRFLRFQEELLSMIWQVNWS